MPGGNNSNRFDKKNFVIIDDLLEDECITHTQHEKLGWSFSNISVQFGKQVYCRQTHS